MCESHFIHHSNQKDNTYLVSICLSNLIRMRRAPPICLQSNLKKEEGECWGPRLSCTLATAVQCTGQATTSHILSASLCNTAVQLSSAAHNSALATPLSGSFQAPSAHANTLSKVSPLKCKHLIHRLLWSTFCGGIIPPLLCSWNTIWCFLLWQELLWPQVACGYGVPLQVRQASLRFSLSPYHRDTTVAQNHNNMINATQNVQYM